MAMYRKLGKKTKLRKALLRNQVTALIYHGRITTTEARAKEIRKIVEPMITMAVRSSTASASLFTTKSRNRSPRMLPAVCMPEGRSFATSIPS